MEAIKNFTEKLMKTHKLDKLNVYLYLYFNFLCFVTSLFSSQI